MVKVTLPVDASHTTKMRPRQTVQWTCKKASFSVGSFKLVGSLRARRKKAGRAKKQGLPPANPFPGKWPKSAPKNGIVRSGRPKSGAVGYRYCYQFKLGSKRKDPIIDIER